jgi:WD40 repeat protein
MPVDPTFLPRPASVVCLWHLASKHEALRLKAHSMPVKSIAFSPDGRWLSTATGYSPEKSGEVRIWFADPPNKEPIHWSAPTLFRA